MNLKWILFSFAAQFAAEHQSFVDADHVHDTPIEYSYIETKLPKAISDLTATSLDSKIYVFGGCDSDKGNELITEYNYFACLAISDASYAFDPSVEEFVELSTMPRQRYRHAAAVFDGNIWLIGGRDGNDAIISEIDVYNPVEDKWTTPASIPSSMISSDLAAFSDSTYIYFVGGYNAEYTALKTAYRFMPSDPTLIEEVASLNEERGDVLAVVEGDYAYVTGGFTHKNNWCIPHETVEKYSLVDNSWELVDSLNINRGDKALINFNGYIIAMGGETKTDCTGDPGETTMPLNDVEYFKPGLEDVAEWHHLAPLPDDRFRFSAATYGDTIYVFGGQKYYDSDCMCFATSDLVLKYDLDVHVLESGEDYEGSMDGESGASYFGVLFAAGVTLGSVVGLMF